MKISNQVLTILALMATVNAQGDQCTLQGAFLLEFSGVCNYATLLSAYTDQVYNVAGATTDECGGGAQDSLDATLALAGLTAEELCASIYDQDTKIPFSDAANKNGNDLTFEQHFYNGRTSWQEEVETIYESDDGSATSILKEDAESVRAFYEGVAQGRRVEWPGSLTNFQSLNMGITDANGLATCDTNAAMCCWPKDRQANDNNGNCGKAYDINCVDKDPADNTDLCFVDMNRGNASNEFESGMGNIVFPEDNNNGEGAIHCHGLAWSNDVHDASARYKANNLFYVSMYDHMYQRGYVENIPGAPMCGCVEQMPTVSRSDCTQVDLTETIKIVFDPTKNTLTGKLTSIDIEFNACQGINNRNNDLWAYMARLYYQGDITPEQFGQAGRIITDQGCEVATEYQFHQQGLTRGYVHDTSTFTKVAGRDSLYETFPYDKLAFYSALFDHSLTAPSDPTTAPFDQTPILKRVCATCVESHAHIYYRRLTPIENKDFDLLDNLLYQRNNGGGDNVWGEDFTLHSTYDDAVSGANPWKCNGGVYNYGVGFPGECSPDGTRVTNQHSRFPSRGKTDVAWYVNKPEGEGIMTFDMMTTDGRFTDMDIGSVIVPGRTFVNEDGSYHISSSGTIGNYKQQRDAFRYLSEPMSGDVQVDVHLASFTDISSAVWGKAGIMLRSSNDPDAEFAYALMNGKSGLNLKVRQSKGGYPADYGTADYSISTDRTAWLRLIKKMETIEMWKSADGISWTFHTSAVVLFPNDEFRVGMAVCSNDDTDLSDATFKSYSVQAYNFPTSAPSISSAPTMWTPSIDIGEVQRAGSYVPENPDTGITILRGSGTGTWGRHDSFFFHNEQMDASTNFTMECYINAFGNNWEHSMGGLMVRDDNDSNAANAFIAITGRYQGVAFQSRGVTGAATDHHSFNWVKNNNVWLKLVKSGSTLSAYYKHVDDAEYTRAGDTELTLTGGTVTVGLAVTAGDTYQYALTQVNVEHYSVVDNNSSTRRLRSVRGLGSTARRE